LEEIYDLFAVRIIIDTKDNSECFIAYSIVTEIYKPIPERFKDYISVPKRMGTNPYTHSHRPGWQNGGSADPHEGRCMISRTSVAAHWIL